jgi:hypothetical protein
MTWQFHGMAPILFFRGGWGFWLRFYAYSRSPGEESPTRVVSIRAIDGYLGKDEPKIGNRLLIHALVKFDTKQASSINPICLDFVIYTEDTEHLPLQ